MLSFYQFLSETKDRDDLIGMVIRPFQHLPGHGDADVIGGKEVDLHCHSTKDEDGRQGITVSYAVNQSYQRQGAVPHVESLRISRLLQTKLGKYIEDHKPHFAQMMAAGPKERRLYRQFGNKLVKRFGGRLEEKELDTGGHQLKAIFNRRLLKPQPEIVRKPTRR